MGIGNGWVSLIELTAGCLAGLSGLGEQEWGGAEGWSKQSRAESREQRSESREQRAEQRVGK